MKKLQRIKLASLTDEFSPLNTTQQKSIKGGEYTSPWGTTFYTSSEVSSMIDNGTWDGGWISGVGYIEAGKTSEEINAMDLGGELSLSYAESVLDNSSGYNVYPSGYYDGSYDTTGEQLLMGSDPDQSQFSEFCDKVAGVVISVIPGAKTLVDLADNHFNDMNDQFARDAWGAEITSRENLHIIRTVTGNNDTEYYMYDSNENLISSGNMNTIKGWKKYE